MKMKRGSSFLYLLWRGQSDLFYQGIEFNVFWLSDSSMNACVWVCVCACVFVCVCACVFVLRAFALIFNCVYKREGNKTNEVLTMEAWRKVEWITV